MVGLNSNTQYSVDFVPTHKGITQVYHGLQPTCGNLQDDSSKLPDILFDRQSARKGEFLKVDDDAKSDRFKVFN